MGKIELMAEFQYKIVNYNSSVSITHWCFIDPLDDVVCDVCSCQSDIGPWNLVVSPLQVSEKGAGGVPEPVDEPSSRAAIVNGVGTCTSYNW